MKLYKIIETDNFGRDYPNERELSLPPMLESSARAIAKAINEQLSGGTAARYWLVVPVDTKLQGGFTP